jgi:hypothetical protein
MRTEFNSLRLKFSRAFYKVSAYRMKLSDYIKAGNLLTNWITIKYSRKIVCHEIVELCVSKQTVIFFISDNVSHSENEEKKRM